MPYRVRRTDLGADRAEILRLWAANLPVKGELDAKLRWFYCDGPYGEGDGFVLHAVGDPTGVGYAGLGQRAMWRRGTPLRAALIADLAIDREHRGGLPELALVRAVKQHVHAAYDLGYGFPDPGAAPIYRRAGFRELGQMGRYVRVLRSGPYAAEGRVPAPVARALGGLANRGRHVASRATALRDRRVKLCWLDDFDARFDRLWDEARQRPHVMSERTAALLRWRFGAQPQEDYRIAALVDRASQRLRAYAVVRVTERVAELVDLFGAAALDVEVMLRQLVPALHAAGLRAVSFRFLGACEMLAVLARQGFTRRDSPRSVVIVLGEAHEPALELADPGSWYLTELDEDT